MKWQKFRIVTVITLSLTFLNTQDGTHTAFGSEILNIEYSLSDARNLLKFATNCKLPEVRNMLLEAGLKHKNPPEIITIKIPRILETLASWYGKSDGFHGKKKANGALMNRNDPKTAAHQFLPLGTVLKVTNKKTGLEHKVTVEDRGTCRSEIGIDLSYAAAKKIAITEIGVAPVKAEIVSLPHKIVPAR